MSLPSRRAQPSPHDTIGVRQAEIEREPNRVKRIFKLLGPGFITGASDADPTSIGTYAKAGATLGFATLWTPLYVLPLLAAVQFTCSKVGMVSGRGLAGVLRLHYPRWLLWSTVAALVVANTINAAADLGAIAASLEMMIPVPMAALLVATGIAVLLLQVLASYRHIEDVFKWLALALFAYVGAGFLSRPDAGPVLVASVLPTIQWNGLFVSTLVALLGTVISPYLFFWQATQEVEDKTKLGQKRPEQRKGTTSAEVQYAAWDVVIGMVFSSVVGYFVILATGATLFHAGKADVDTAAQVAEALRPLAGNASAILLAIGLIGSGCLTVPVLTTSTAYAVAEAFRLPRSLDARVDRAKAFYGVIGGTTVVAVALNFVGINPISALFWSSVLNGIVAPPLLVVLLLVARRRDIMGHRVIGPLVTALGWITAIVMTLAAIALFLTWNQG